MREWWIHEYEGERGGLQDRIQPFKKLPLSWSFWNVDILLHVAVFRSKAIFSNICMPCDIKHRLQTRETDLFLVLLVVVRGDFSFSHAWEGEGHMKQGRRPAKVWISNVCPQFYPDLRCEKLILNFEIFHTVFRAKRSIINMNAYLIFVISFTQAALSISKFYTQKFTKNTPKHWKMSLKSKIYAVLVFNRIKFYTWQNIFTRAPPMVPV